jgi:hypothetical protein
VVDKENKDKASNLIEKKIPEKETYIPVQTEIMSKNNENNGKVNCNIDNLFSVYKNSSLFNYNLEIKINPNKINNVKNTNSNQKEFKGEKNQSSDKSKFNHLNSNHQKFNKNQKIERNEFMKGKNI